MIFSRRSLVNIVVPLMVSQVLSVAIGMEDSIMVSSAGEAAISGVSLVDMICNVLITLFAAVLSLYIALWSVVISLWAVELALAGTALVGVVALPVSLIQGNVWAGIALLGAGIFAAGLSMFGFYGCLYVTKGACLLGKKLFLFVKRCFIRKEAVR